jgi:hypothetical protein
MAPPIPGIHRHDRAAPRDRQARSMSLKINASASSHLDVREITLSPDFSPCRAKAVEEFDRS